jgi:hypothetical protein
MDNPQATSSLFIPITVRQFALKHQINLGRDCFGYFIRERGRADIFDTTKSANPTAANALALCRNYLRVVAQRERESGVVDAAVQS